MSFPLSVPSAERESNPVILQASGGKAEKLENDEPNGQASDESSLGIILF
jgi:hypothetical protein